MIEYVAELLNKNGLQTSVNSIAQCGAQEHPSTRHRKNSRNPVIKKEEIIPPNNDGWNYPCPGIAQGVTASNSVVVSGVASRYGDNSNSLINEHIEGANCVDADNCTDLFIILVYLSDSFVVLGAWGCSRDLVAPTAMQTADG